MKQSNNSNIIQEALKELELGIDLKIEDVGIDEALSEYPFHTCPDCNLPPNQHIYKRFRTSDWTWEHLCGRAGLLAICPRCSAVNEILITEMN